MGPNLTKSQHHHWFLHIQISLDTKFQFKLKILICWTKFASKGYLRPKNKWTSLLSYKVVVIMLWTFWCLTKFSFHCKWNQTETLYTVTIAIYHFTLASHFTCYFNCFTFLVKFWINTVLEQLPVGAQYKRYSIKMHSPVIFRSSKQHGFFVYKFCEIFQNSYSVKYFRTAA